MILSVPKERADEPRVAAIPETVKKLAAKGFEIRVERGAGARAGFSDEAYEEAGVRTRTTDSVIGFFTYLKVQGGRKMPVVVAVFPSEVTQELPHWPEKGQRRRKWVGRKKAAKMVDAPELAAIIRNFDPSKL